MSSMLVGYKVILKRINFFLHTSYEQSKYKIKKNNSINNGSFPGGASDKEPTYQCKASLVAQSLKHPPAMLETRARSLGQEDPLEKEMATHSSILAWRIPWTEEPGGLRSIVLQRRT